MERKHAEIVNCWEKE